MAQEPPAETEPLEAARPTRTAGGDTPGDTGLVSVYVTFPAGFAADDLVTDLVRERLIACANLFPGLTSIYTWGGRVERDPETAALLKTTADRLDALVARIRQSHPYETPCIVAWPVIGGFPPYLDWVRTETRD